jgi:predicted metal-binding protein
MNLSQVTAAVAPIIASIKNINILGGSDHVESDRVHVCHICTTCQDDCPDSSIAPDIEDLRDLNSGAIMFHLLLSALTEPNVGGWNALEDAGVHATRGIDAGPDPRLCIRKLSLRDDPRIKLNVVPVRCLSLCGAPHALALRGGDDKFAYQFGRINIDTLDDMVEMITEYCRSSDGYSSTRSRPASLKGHVSARIPPMNGRVAIDQ